MATFMAVARFSPERDLPQITAVIPEEVAQVRKLTDEGRLGAVRVSPARGRVFLEVYAEDEIAARVTVETLPMSRWWDIEIFPIAEPTMTPQAPTSTSNSDR